jgi:hypothetical protein
VSGTLPGADVRGFYAALGIELPGWAQQEASVACFADPDAHRHGDRDPSCSVNVQTGLPVVMEQERTLRRPSGRAARPPPVGQREGPAQGALGEPSVRDHPTGLVQQRWQQLRRAVVEMLAAGGAGGELAPDQQLLGGERLEHLAGVIAQRGPARKRA